MTLPDNEEEFPKKLYAKWKANTYTITVNPNGGKIRDGINDPIIVEYDSIPSRKKKKKD